MKKLSQAIGAFIEASGHDAKGIMNASARNLAYKNAVGHVWKRSEAAQMVLDHTNAFYVREDTTPRKGPDKDKKYIVCEICIDDPTVRSEVDNMRYLLELSLRSNGLTFNELRIIPARRGMRKRHPFANHT